MNAELILSRASYQTGAPVVGSVRIHRPPSKCNADGDCNNDHVEGDATAHPQHRPIRDEIVSARLYLAGRAHLGSNARSRWRSTQEVNQLKKIYGEHACLTMAKVEEKSSWDGRNPGADNTVGGLGEDDANDMKTSPDGETSDNGTLTKATFCNPMPPPKVPHIEQAERLAVHSQLHHSYNPMNDKNALGTGDYSHLPTPHENNAICFWMTNVLELLDVPERHVEQKNGEGTSVTALPGRGKYYGDMYPYRPLQLPDLQVVKDVLKRMENDADRGRMGGTGEHSLFADEGPGEVKSEQGTLDAWERIVSSARKSVAMTEKLKDESALEEIQLAVTFRADLSVDLPPTITCECVKYFYSAVLALTTAEGELIVTQSPFAVLASALQYSRNQNSHQTTTTRVHIGDLHAFAHSAGLPTYISATRASDATLAQLTVNASSPACDIISRRTAEQRTSTHRIVDSMGRYCGSMTLIGLGGPLVPGLRLGIRMKFPTTHENDNGPGIIACHRVCCALVGEEHAIFEGSADATENPASSKRRVKTRSYVFDSAYEMVDFGYTEAISMGLVLPLDCPVTVKTDLVEMKTMLKVEFTVSKAWTTESHNKNEITGSKDEGEFSVIRLDLPCEVVHERSSNRDEEVEHISSDRTIQQFLLQHNKMDGFEDPCVQEDLKVLSSELMAKSNIHRRFNCSTT